MSACHTNRPMVMLSSIITIAGFGGLGMGTAAGQPPDEHAPSYAVEAAAREFVGKYEGVALMDDATFVAALKSLAESTLSPEAKADAFALMQDRIGWLFVGALRLFPDRNFHQTAVLRLSTYVQYQQQMPKGLDVGPLLELAKSARPTHTIRSSNARLLAVILNHEAAAASVGEAIDLNAIKGAEVPAIDLHNLAYSTALSLNRSNVAKLIGLLPKVESEESREDVMASLSIYGNDEVVRGTIEDWVKSSFPASFDNSVQTALAVLASMGPEDHFVAFYQALGEAAGEDGIRKLSDLWDGGFMGAGGRPPAGQVETKVWDGFRIRVENDGIEVFHGATFRAWMGR